jgi:hypothetical protein
MSESGIEKSIRRIITTVVFVVAGVLLCLGIRALAHWLGGVTLPDLSNHDFEWLVLAFLFVITVNVGGSCNCKCK